MPALPKAAFFALVLVSTLAGCGDGSKAANSGPTASSSVTSAPTAATTSPSSTPSTSASTDPRPSPSSTACGPTGHAVPDGTWHGPITMDVHSDGAQSAYPDSSGTGQLTMTVHDGRVTSGTWTATWKSHGEASTADAAATVDFTGTATGTATGGASRPVLPDTWKIQGTVKIAKPRNITAPIDETGSDRPTMAIKASTCDQVKGTFRATFRSKETAATFAGTATWIGTRT